MTTSVPDIPGQQQVAFDAFQMDVGRHRLWRGAQEIPLRPKAWDVLWYLLERPGLLITKEGFHRAIWPDTAVSDDTLTKVIAEVRQALEDDPRKPRIIETVHGRGFRLIVEVTGLGTKAPASAYAAATLADSRDGATAATFVGRQRELARLDQSLRLAADGTRQLVFITGEAGIGKTTLVEEFLRSVAQRDPDTAILYGQCMQQHGQREAYMPVLDALERILTSPLGPTLIPEFRRVAPCWYAQIPWLLSQAAPADWSAAMTSAAPQRMLRESAAFLDGMAARSTVIVVLEDLHWSDHATTDLVAYLAERRDPARLLILGTYRPADAITQEHPIREVRQTLRAHGRAVDVELPYLSTAHVREYLQRRSVDPGDSLATLIHERTDGSPLFVVAVVDELIRRRQASAGLESVRDVGAADLAVPDDLLEMVAAQFHSLAPDARAVLEAASVAGVSFAPWMVARALERDVETVEDIAEQMVRSYRFLTVARRAEESSLASRYDFSHALHHQVIYGQVPEERRRRLHQAIGEALESAYGDHLAEIAPRLSVHFERSQDHARAAKYLRLCITGAQQRLAHREAVVYGSTALGLLRGVPETPERDRAELQIRLLHGVSLNVTRGYLSSEVRENYERAQLLAEQAGDAAQAFQIAEALWYPHLGGGDEAALRRSVDDLARIAAQLDTEEHRLRADVARGRTELWTGHCGLAARILTQAARAIEKHADRVRAPSFGVRSAVAAFAQGAVALWLHGFPDQARVFAARGIVHADEGGQPFDAASALSQLTFVELVCGDADAAAAAADRAAAICRAHDVVYLRPLSHFMLAAARAAHGDVEGALPDLLRSLEEQRVVSGSFVADFMLAFTAGVLAQAGRWTEALARVDDGIAILETSVERAFAAELWRVKGEVLLGAAGRAKRRTPAPVARSAEQCFRRALEIAREQEAASLALRAAMSLAGMAGAREAGGAAAAPLREIYKSFTEGFGTRDLTDAGALLRE